MMVDEEESGGEMPEMGEEEEEVGDVEIIDEYTEDKGGEMGEGIPAIEEEAEDVVDMAHSTFSLHKDSVFCVDMSENEKWALSGGQDDMAYLWTPEDFTIDADEPSETSDLPSKTGNLPSTTGNLPSTTSNLPSTTSSLPSCIDQPSTSSDLPYSASLIADVAQYILRMTNEAAVDKCVPTPEPTSEKLTVKQIIAQRLLEQNNQGPASVIRSAPASNIGLSSVAALLNERTKLFLQSKCETTSANKRPCDEPPASEAISKCPRTEGLQADEDSCCIQLVQEETATDVIKPKGRGPRKIHQPDPNSNRSKKAREFKAGWRKDPNYLISTLISNPVMTTNPSQYINPPSGQIVPAPVTPPASITQPNNRQNIPEDASLANPVGISKLHASVMPATVKGYFKLGGNGKEIYQLYANPNSNTQKKKARESIQGKQRFHAFHKEKTVTVTVAEHHIGQHHSENPVQDPATNAAKDSEHIDKSLVNPNPDQDAAINIVLDEKVDGSIADTNSDHVHSPDEAANKGQERALEANTDVVPATNIVLGRDLEVDTPLAPKWLELNQAVEVDNYVANHLTFIETSLLIAYTGGRIQSLLQQEVKMRKKEKWKLARIVNEYQSVCAPDDIKRAKKLMIAVEKKLIEHMVIWIELKQAQPVKPANIKGLKKDLVRFKKSLASHLADAYKQVVVTLPNPDNMVNVGPENHVPPASNNPSQVPAASKVIDKDPRQSSEDPNPARVPGDSLFNPKVQDFLTPAVKPKVYDFPTNGHPYRSQEKDRIAVNVAEKLKLIKQSLAHISGYNKKSLKRYLAKHQKEKELLDQIITAEYGPKLSGKLWAHQAKLLMIDVEKRLIEYTMALIEICLASPTHDLPYIEGLQAELFVMKRTIESHMLEYKGQSAVAFDIVEPPSNNKAIPLDSQLGKEVMIHPKGQEKESGAPDWIHQSRMPSAAAEWQNAGFDDVRSALTSLPSWVHYSSALPYVKEGQSSKEPVVMEEWVHPSRMPAACSSKPEIPKVPATSETSVDVKPDQLMPSTYESFKIAVRVKPGIKWDQIQKHVLQNEVELTLLKSEEVNDNDISKVFICSDNVVVQCGTHSSAIAARYILETNLTHIVATGPGICLKMSLAVPQRFIHLSGPSLVDTLQQLNPTMPPKSMTFIKFQLEMFNRNSYHPAPQKIGRTIAYVYVTPAAYTHIEQMHWRLWSGFEAIIIIRAGGSK